MSNSKKLAVVTLIAALVVAGLALTAIFTVQDLPPGTTLAGETISDPSTAAQTVQQINTELSQRQVVVKAGDASITTTLGDLGFSLSEAVMVTHVQEHIGFNAWMSTFLSGSPSIPLEFTIHQPPGIQDTLDKLRTNVEDGDVSIKDGVITTKQAVEGVSVTYDNLEAALKLKLYELSSLDVWPDSVTIEPKPTTVQPSITQEIVDDTVSSINKMVDTPFVVSGTIMKEGTYQKGEVTLTRAELLPALSITKDMAAVNEADRLQIVKAAELPPIPPQLAEVVPQGSIFPTMKVNVANRSATPPKGSTEAQKTDVKSITGTLVPTEGEKGFMANVELTYYGAIDAMLNGQHASQFVGVPIDGTDLGAIGIKAPIGTYTTYFTPGQSRNQNIKRIAQIVNGTIIPAGSNFEVNHFVGRRTTEKGFGPGGAIANGAMVTATGGGVSQFATTFFNAMWFSGVEIVEFHPHSYYFSRYPLGREATIDYPSVNLEMRNNTPYAILVEAITTDNSVTVTFWSTPYFTVSQKLSEAVPTSYGSQVTIERTTVTPSGQSERKTFKVNYKKQAK